MKLKTYLAEIGMTVKNFSTLAKCDQRYMSRIMNGHLKPGKRLAQDVEDLTEGKVKLLEQYDSSKNKDIGDIKAHQ